MRGATLRAGLSGCSAGVGCSGVHGTPTARGTRVENELVATEGFKELDFTADLRGRIENCLSEICAF